jgi:PAS domain S-box-containing protein
VNIDKGVLAWLLSETPILDNPVELLDLSLDAIFVGSGPDHVVTYWNHGAELIYGYSSAEVLGRAAPELLFTKFPIPLAEIDAELAREGFWDGELIQRRKDGTEVTVICRWAVRMGVDGQPIATVEVNRDITAQRVAEQLLAVRAVEVEKANLDLARSNEDLAQFAYVASHDLSEPLRAISGPLSLLANRYKDQLDEDAETFIGFAVDGCQRMQSIINELLAYSRIGRVEGPLENVNCNELLATVLAGLAPTIDETGGQVVVGELPVVIAEPTQLSQVFQNLVSNGLKFVAAGLIPLVTVTAERVEEIWKFKVTDNGIGIKPEHRERIFGMFKRLHGREDYPGSGIGLALCKRIIEQHDGSIGVEGAPEGGTCFWFTLTTPKGADE